MYQEQAADYPAPTKEYTTETQAKGYIKQLEQTHFGAVRDRPFDILGGGGGGGGWVFSPDTGIFFH